MDKRIIEKKWNFVKLKESALVNLYTRVRVTEKVNFYTHFKSMDCASIVEKYGEIKASNLIWHVWSDARRFLKIAEMVKRTPASIPMNLEGTSLIGAKKYLHEIDELLRYGNKAVFIGAAVLVTLMIVRKK